MKEYLVCSLELGYVNCLKRARKLTEEERQEYMENCRDRIFVGIGEEIPLENLDILKIKELLNRPEDGAFPGSYNQTYIVSQEEWDQLVEMEKTATEEKEATKRAAAIAEYENIIRVCEKQEKLYTEEEAKRKRKEYNNLYNEGGEGYVPHFYTIDDYEWAKEKLRKVREEQGS